MQSNGDLCAHNTLAGPAVVRFVLAYVRHRALSAGRIDQVWKRVEQLARTELGADTRQAGRASAEKELKKVTHQLQVAARNMTLAESPEELQDMRAVVNELRLTKQQLEERVRKASAEVGEAAGISEEVGRAMAGLDRMAGLAEQDPRRQSDF